MRPTGRFHLGNYLGAAKNWVELQNRYECFYFVADYHALTTEPDGHKAEDKVFDLTADLLAVGIDPSRSVVYLQSKVPEAAELGAAHPDLQGDGEEASGQRQSGPALVPDPAGSRHPDGQG